MNQYRQGDVLLIRVDSIPADVTKVKRDKGSVILAYGEVTGHAHRIDDTVAELFEKSGVEDRFLSVPNGASLTHEEHGKIDLEPGDYTVRIQRSLNPMDLKPNKVVD